MVAAWRCNICKGSVNQRKTLAASTVLAPAMVPSYCVTAWSTLALLEQNKAGCSRNNPKTWNLLQPIYNIKQHTHITHASLQVWTWNTNTSLCTSTALRFMGTYGAPRNRRSLGKANGNSVSSAIQTRILHPGTPCSFGRLAVLVLRVIIHAASM